jgi:hypothetical protein
MSHEKPESQASSLAGHCSPLAASDIAKIRSGHYTCREQN